MQTINSGKTIHAIACFLNGKISGTVRFEQTMNKVKLTA